LSPVAGRDSVSGVDKPSNPISGPTVYVPPALRLLGSVSALTQQTVDKQLGPTDGFTFMGAPIANASP
jgi:hypothetical protein